MTDPLSHSTHNEYDKSGRLFSTTDARGTVVEYGYDGVNRVVDVAGSSFKSASATRS